MSWVLLTEVNYTDGVAPGTYGYIGRNGVTDSVGKVEPFITGSYNRFFISVIPTNSASISYSASLYKGDYERWYVLENFEVNSKVYGVFHELENTAPAFYFKLYTTSTRPIVSGEVVGTGDGTKTSFSKTLAHPVIVPNTLVVHYTISSTAYTATDDGAGNVSGTNCSGTINYQTGDLSLTFTTAPDSGTSITADYDEYMTFRYRIYAR